MGPFYQNWIGFAARHDLTSFLYTVKSGMSPRPLALALFLSLACKTPATTTQADATTTQADLAVDMPPAPSVLPPLKACTRDTQCPWTLGCHTECAAQFDEHGTQTSAHCMILAEGGGVGAKPCFGHISRNSWGAHTSHTDLTYGLLCDVDQKGAYCDYKTNVCVKVKPLGAACDGRDGQCGKDGDCYKGKCVAGAEVGASCKDIHCIASAHCDAKTTVCVASTPLGGKCSTHDDCASLWCIHETCVAHGPPEVCVPPR
jgi:hypothetical protein